MLKKQLMKTTTTTLFLCCFFVFQSFDQVIGQDCKDSYPNCPQWENLCNTMESVRNACSKTCKNCVSEGGWSKWSRWSECSVSCGGGTQTRTRDCMGASANCPGDNKKERECNKKACPNEDCKDTALWCEEYDSYCSTPYVKNLCKVTCEDCDGGGSTGWTPWTDWTACSVSCGVGIEDRTRTCQGGSCPGLDYESQDCERGECQGDCKDIANWCKQYVSYCGAEDDYVKKKCMNTCNACSSGNFRWSDWTAWACDVTCGTGMETRTRECQEGDCEGDAIETQSCTQDTCPPDETGYGPWTEYGTCSDECGGGVHSRTRTCLSGRCTKHSTEIKNCNEQECANNNCEDQPSRQCSDRKAYNQCQDYPIVRDTWCPKMCGSCTGGDGPSWGQYGPCSVACGVGLKTRTKDSISQSITCVEPECGAGSNWNPWTQWSQCSKTCGRGTQTRERTCSQGQAGACSGPSSQSRVCEPQACPTWDNWGSWSDCSPSCGPGKKTRSRTCSVEGQCSGLATSEMDCKLKDCEVAKWNDWSDWSDCTKTCGVGKRKRIRTCSISGQCGSLPGESEMEENCNTPTCPEWSIWLRWTDCSKTCGTGSLEMARACSIPNGCDGNFKETWDCNTIPCEEDINNWSTCSKTCGGGTSKRFRFGTWQFRACGNGPCQEVPCSVLNPLIRNKYVPDKSKCCNKVHIPSGEICGTNKDERQIIGGVNADKKRWPWTTGLYSNGKGFCGGTLISSKFVISAAHCFAEDNGLPFDIKDWQWILGTLNLKEQRKYEKIKTATVHPDYSYPYNDIAITEFTKPVTFDNHIHPLCLPHGEETPFDYLCYVVGWGVSTIPDKVTHHLQQAAILNFDPRVCIDAYGKHSSLRQHLPYLKKNKGYLCAGSLTNEVDSCSGDSGGPLLCQRCDSCTWYLAGVVSFGPHPCTFKGVPAIYTRVVHYEEWIYKVTNITKHNLQCKNAA